DRDEAFAHFDEALALLEDAPPSMPKTWVLGTVARFHAIELRTDHAIRFGNEALAMADELGLDEARAHMLNTIGFARISGVDEAGIADIEESLRIAQERNSPESIRAYLNLGTAHAHFGNLDKAFHVHEEGRRAAERFGDTAGMQWFAAERLWELYWVGGWDEA